MTLDTLQNATWWRCVLPVALIVAALYIGVSGNTYWMRLATTFTMYATLALSWNLIGGMTGYPSFATAAFFGLGTYAGGILQAHDVSFVLAALGAAVVTCLCAGLLGMLVLHLRGHYFAIATLMVGDVVQEIANNAQTLTGGGMGMNLPMLSGGILNQSRFYLVAMAVCCVGAALLCVIVAHSRLGVGLRCIAQNEVAAESIGISTRRYKNAAFMLSGVFVGASGAVYASWVTYIDPSDVFDIMLAVKPIVMVLLGGASVWLGPVVGALIFLAFEELAWRNMLHFHAGMLGIFIALLVIYLPSGMGARATWKGLGARILRRSA